MRCPKCGYISFDHVDVCLKCNKDISKFTAKVIGTTYNATPPSFLRFEKISESSSGRSSGRALDHGGRSDFDVVVDPDLKVLVNGDDEEEDTEISFRGGFEGMEELAEEENFEISLEGEGDGDDVGIDLGRFEDAFDEQGPAIPDTEIKLDLPDELADLSDLSAPKDAPIGRAIKEKQSLSPAPDLMEEDFDDFNLNLDLDDINDDFSLASTEESGEKEKEDLNFTDLSLDDMGLSETEKKPAREKKSGKGVMDMDADLNFDLDLGGLSLDDDV